MKKVKDPIHLMTPEQHLWENLRVNDKKGVYLLIIICNAYVNATYVTITHSQDLLRLRLRLNMTINKNMAT